MYIEFLHDFESLINFISIIIRILLWDLCMIFLYTRLYLLYNILKGFSQHTSTELLSLSFLFGNIRVTFLVVYERVTFIRRKRAECLFTPEAACEISDVSLLIFFPKKSEPFARPRATITHFLENP